MGWFSKFCRDAGLMVHHLGSSLRETPGGASSVKRDDDAPAVRGEVKRTVRQETTESDGKVVLRRTTVEEVELPLDATRPTERGDASRSRSSDD